MADLQLWDKWPDGLDVLEVNIYTRPDGLRLAELVDQLNQRGVEPAVSSRRFLVALRDQDLGDRFHALVRIKKDEEGDFAVEITVRVGPATLGPSKIGMDEFMSLLSDHLVTSLFRRFGFQGWLT